MSVEITEFVDVSIAVSPTGVAGGNFGILGFLTDEEGVISPAQRSRSYTSLASVGDDWAAGNEVYKAAQGFYAQTPTPKDYTVLMCFGTAQVASLTGGGHQELVDLLAIAGTSDFTITVDGTEAVMSTLDFSGAADLAAVAATVTTALSAIVTGATCTHNGTQFSINGVTAGAAGTMTFGVGSTASALGLAQHQGVVANGLDPETPVQALAANVSNGTDFVGLVTHKKYRDVIGGADGTNTIDIATWAEASKKIFCNTSNDLTVLDPNITSDVASALKAATLRFSLTTFSKSSSQYPSAAVFGRAASVNFSANNTTITLNLKQIATITAENLTPGEFAALRGKNASAVIVAGKGTNVYTESRMASGSWLDTTHGLLWLENRCEVDLFNLLYTTTTKVPYTQVGLNTTVNMLKSSLRAAVINGLAGPGYLSDGTFLEEGFIVESVPLADIPTSDVGNRIYKGLSFKMKGAGALHELEVSGSFTE